MIPFAPEQIGEQVPTDQKQKQHASLPDRESIGELDLTHQEEDAPLPDSEDTPPARLQRPPFDGKAHRARTAGWALGALLGMVGIIVVGSFLALLFRMEHIEISDIELLVFANIALLAVVASPILRYLSKDDSKGDSKGDE